MEQYRYVGVGLPFLIIFGIARSKEEIRKVDRKSHKEEEDQN